MKKLGYYLRFEFKKRHWMWPLVVFLTLGLSAGFWQQQYARTQYLQEYSQRLKKRYTRADQLGSSEIEAFKKTPASYHQWYMNSLAVNLSKRQATRSLDGFGVRMYANVDNVNGVLINSMARTYTQFQYMLRNQITPMYPDSLDIQSSAGDLSSLNEQSTQMVLKDNPQYYLQGWYYLWFLIRSNSIVLLLVIGSIVTGRLWAKELENKKAHSNWLLLQGLNPFAQICTEFLTIFSTFIQIVLLPLSLITLGVGLTAGWGDLRYPVFNFSDPNGFGLGESFMALRNYLTQAMILVVLLILFMTLINLCLAQLLKNSWLTTIGMLLLIGITQVMPSVPNFPLTYFNVNDTITGILQKNTGSDALQPSMVIMNMTWWCVVLFAILIIPATWSWLSQFFSKHRIMRSNTEKA